MHRSLIVAALFLLAGCAPPAAGPLVSAQAPPAAQSARSEPQTLNSLPPGAANLSRAPNATAPNYLSLGVRAF